MASVLSIVESPLHGNFSALYSRLGLKEQKVTSMRRAMAEIKKNPPDIIVAEFFYGYGNNYAGVNISNLDVMLYSLQKYSPLSRVIVMVDKSERQHVHKLNDIFSLHAILQQPVKETDLEAVLK